MSEPPSLPTTPAGKTRNGLGITSLVLGVFSLCLLMLAGIPAIVTGHIAFNRAKKQPDVYGGAGFALAGLILGYISIPITFIALLAGLLLPALSKAKGKAQSIQCVSQLKQIGLAARMYAVDHNDQLPPDFLSMTNELPSPKLLACPNDKTKTKAEDWSQFSALQNITYEFLTPGVKTPAPQDVAFRCPIHGNIGLGDGSVQRSSGR